MEGLSGTLAGCRAGMRLGLAQLLGEGAGGTDSGAGLGGGQLLFLLRFTGLWRERQPLTDRRVVWTRGLRRETVGQFMHGGWGWGLSCGGAPEARAHGYLREVARQGTRWCNGPGVRTDLA